MTVSTSSAPAARRSLFNAASVSVDENNVREDVPDDDEFDDIMGGESSANVAKTPLKGNFLKESLFNLITINLLPKFIIMFSKLSRFNLISKHHSSKFEYILFFQN